jgi:cytochrome c-type biogenesis protein CcmH/NrfF
MESVALRRRALAVASAALLLAAVGVGASATSQAADEPTWAYALWHDLMSPYCPGRTLAECPSPAADELRIWILTQAAAGASREEVEASLYTRFGDQIRTTPRAEGWGLAAYVIPAVAFVLFGGIVLLALRRLVGGNEMKAQKRVDPSVSALPFASGGPVGTGASAGGQSDAELERLVDEELGG